MRSKSNKRKLAMLIVMTSCAFTCFAATAVEREAEDEGSRAKPVEEMEWIRLEAPAALKGKPRVLLIHDMEGLSGQDDPRTFLSGYPPQYELGRRLLTDDVNAVIEGLFEGGAGSVSVADGHGSGNPEADVFTDRLDRRAPMVTRSAPFDTYLDLATPGAFDAVVVVGMHAKSGSRGFASHTYSIGSQILVNGRSITETELVGLLQGRVGAPVIFASGDDRLAADLATMPWIRYVTVKRATSASTAELFPVEEVHAQMRREAKAALQNLSSAKVMRTKGILRVSVKAVAPANFRWLEGMPGIDYRNDTASFLASDMAAAYRGIRPLVTALAFSFSDATLSAFRALPEADELKHAGSDELYRRWFEAETAGAPSPPPRAPAAAGEYHGFR